MPAFPALNDPPCYPLDPDGELEDAVLRSPLQAGYQQTRPKFTRFRRSFGVRYKMKDADVATLRAFEQTTLVNGSASFTWVHPLRGTNHTVQLIGPIKYGKNNLPLTDVSFTLQEV